MTTWVDVAVRARGLAGRLLRDDQLAALAGSRDLVALAQRLAGFRGMPAPDGLPDAEELEVAERRHAGAQVRLLGRWCGARARWLAPLFEEEDCRSVRAAVRGAIAGQPADERMAGLVPTPALPERALVQLVGSRDPGAVGALLATWGNPYAGVVLAAARQQQPDLFALELDLARAWAERSRQAARGAGPALRRYVARVVDLGNCWTALLVAGQASDVPADRLFLPGGELVRQDAFHRAAGAAGRAAAAAVLEPLVRQSPLAAVTGPPAGAEERVRRALCTEQRAIARHDPTGPAAIIEFWLRLRGEVQQVQRLIWAIAAGAPLALRGVSHDAA